VSEPQARQHCQAPEAGDVPDARRPRLPRGLPRKPRTWREVAVLASRGKRRAPPLVHPEKQTWGGASANWGQECPPVTKEPPAWIRQPPGLGREELGWAEVMLAKARPLPRFGRSCAYEVVCPRRNVHRPGRPCRRPRSQSQGPDDADGRHDGDHAGHLLFHPHPPPEPAAEEAGGDDQGAQERRQDRHLQRDSGHGDCRSEDTKLEILKSAVGQVVESFDKAEATTPAPATPANN